MQDQKAYYLPPQARSDYMIDPDALECDPAEDVTRQEFKDDTDVNRILRGFGVGFKERPLTYADVDTNIDLQQAIEARQGALRALNALPEPIRTQFPTWEALVVATANGDLKRALKELEEAPPPPDPTT